MKEILCDNESKGLGARRVQTLFLGCTCPAAQQNVRSCTIPELGLILRFLNAVTLQHLRIGVLCNRGRQRWPSDVAVKVSLPTSK